MPPKKQPQFRAAFIQQQQQQLIAPPKYEESTDETSQQHNDEINRIINSALEGDEDVLTEAQLITGEIAAAEADEQQLHQMHADDDGEHGDAEQFEIEGLHDELDGEGEEHQVDEGGEHQEYGADDENLECATADIVGVEGDAEMLMQGEEGIDGMQTNAEIGDEADGFLYILEKDLPYEKRLKLWAKLNKGQKCAVADCFCSTTGAYFPNPYKAHITSDQRRYEEERLSYWSAFCQRGDGWTPQITSRRIQDFIGWMHFDPNDISEHRRIRLHVPQAFKRLRKGATPVNPAILSREQKLINLGVQETTRQRKRRERVEKAAEVAATSSKTAAGRALLKQNQLVNLPKQLPLKRLENALKHEKRMRTRLEEEIDKLKIQVAKGVEGKSLDKATRGVANEMQQLRSENKQLREQLDALKRCLSNSVGDPNSQVIMVEINHE